MGGRVQERVHRLTREEGCYGGHVVKTPRWRPGVRGPGGTAREGGLAGRALATVLFTDIVGSTELADSLGDRRWRAVRERHDRIVRRELKRFGGQEMDTAGDGFFAVFTGPDQALACADALVDELAEAGIAIRAGVHTGLVEPTGEKVGGMAVHIGARIAAQAGPGEILVSNTVRDLISGSEMRFADRGTHELKGVGGTWRLFVVDRPAPVVKPIPELPAERPPRKRRRALLVAALAALLTGAAVSAALVVSGDGPEGDTSAPAGFRGGLARIDTETNRIVNRIGLLRNWAGYVTNPVAVGEGSVWQTTRRLLVGVPGAGTVKINSSTNAIVSRIDAQGAGLAAGHGGVWVAAAADGVLRIDPRTNRVTEVPGSALEGTTGDPLGLGALLAGALGVAVGEDSVWVTLSDGTLLRIDPERQRVVDRIRIGGSPHAIAVAGNDVWVTDPVDAAVLRVDPDRGEVITRVAMTGGATDLAIGAGSIWVTNNSEGTVTQVDLRDGSIVRTITVGERPTAIVEGDGAIWVANSASGTVSRIDSRTKEVTEIRTGGAPGGLAVDESGLWVVVYRNFYTG